MEIEVLIVLQKQQARGRNRNLAGPTWNLVFLVSVKVAWELGVRGKMRSIKSCSAVSVAFLFSLNRRDGEQCESLLRTHKARSGKGGPNEKCPSL